MAVRSARQEAYQLTKGRDKEEAAYKAYHRHMAGEGLLERSSSLLRAAALLDLFFLLLANGSAQLTSAETANDMNRS